MKTPLPDSRAIRKFFDEASENRDRWRRRTYHEEVLRFCRCAIPEGSSVLIIGCGTGDLLAGLKPARGLGIDFSEAMIKRARKKYPNLEFRIGRAENLPEGERFEWIILSDLLGFLPGHPARIQRTVESRTPQLSHPDHALQSPVETRTKNRGNIPLKNARTRAKLVDTPGHSEFTLSLKL